MKSYSLLCLWPEIYHVCQSPKGEYISNKECSQLKVFVLFFETRSFQQKGITHSFPTHSVFSLK